MAKNGGPVRRGDQGCVYETAREYLCDDDLVELARALGEMKGFKLSAEEARRLVLSLSEDGIPSAEIVRRIGLSARHVGPGTRRGTASCRKVVSTPSFAATSATDSAKRGIGRIPRLCRLAASQRLLRDGRGAVHTPLRGCGARLRLPMRPA